jgi:hypothetical protein
LVTIADWKTQFNDVAAARTATASRSAAASVENANPGSKASRNIAKTRMSRPVISSRGSVNIRTMF